MRPARGGAILLAAGLLALAACRGHGPAPARSMESRQAFARPNVLLITIDALRADHLGAYGYRRKTSPRIDAFAASAALFEQAYTFWPKTRGSFAMMFTGLVAARNGYSARRPGILDFNPTLASVLQAAGYRTVAAVDNPNVAKAHGYSKPSLITEVDRTRAITDSGIRALAGPPPDHPLFLWLHYVNPHAPYIPPAPYDTAFLDGEASSGPRLEPVDGVHGGVRKEWAVRGRQLGYYVSQYDGEIATADAGVGRVLDALRQSPAAGRTVVVIASDHGESLGEHDYYFDHGEDLFDPCLRVPLIVSVPGADKGRRVTPLATTLDILPSILDAVKVSYPPDLSGHSLLPAIMARAEPSGGASSRRTTAASSGRSTRDSNWSRLQPRAGAGISSWTASGIRARSAPPTAARGTDCARSGASWTSSSSRRNANRPRRNVGPAAHPLEKVRRAARRARS
jgi:arylsulfatase A-like enzyme